MLSQCTAIRMEQAENDQKYEKMNRFKKFFRNKLKKTSGTRHALVMQEFKLLKKFSDDECKMNAAKLIEDFRVINSASLDSEDSDEEIFNDFIYKKEEDNWTILFDHINQFKEDKKMQDE